jgi:hypothetical protein
MMTNLDKFTFKILTPKLKFLLKKNQSKSLFKERMEVMALLRSTMEQFNWEIKTLPCKGSITRGSRAN